MQFTHLNLLFIFNVLFFFFFIYLFIYLLGDISAHVLLSNPSWNKVYDGDDEVTRRFVGREKTEYLGTTAKAPPQFCSVIKNKMADELN